MPVGRIAVELGCALEGIPEGEVITCAGDDAWEFLGAPFHHGDLGLPYLIRST
jgi:hypothetical protein